MKKFAGFILVTAMLSSPLHAAPADPDSTDAKRKAAAGPATDPEQAEKKPSNKLKKKSKDKNAEQDIFRPSEEISEDFAVPFPVDI